jgi:hypothetical protein
MFARKVLVLTLLSGSLLAATRTHVIVLGKWQAVKATADSGESRDLKVRPLVVDGHIKEYTTGPAHDVTDRLFVVRRVFRLNDSLPEEEGKPPRWTWQLGGWISVDRGTGHVAVLNLPAFDPQTSEASWYRDFAAYCGLSDDGSKAYTVVFQLGRRKPVLRKEFAGDSCAAPKWERSPSRVIFTLDKGEKVSYAVRGHSADLQPASEDEEQP